MTGGDTPQDEHDSTQHEYEVRSISPRHEVAFYGERVQLQDGIDNKTRTTKHPNNVQNQRLSTTKLRGMPLAEEEGGRVDQNQQRV